MRFWDTNGLLNLGQTSRPWDSQQKKKTKKKKRTYRIVDFAVLADHRVKLKEREKRDKYLHLAGELKKLWKVLVTVILIVIGALGTVTKGLVKELEDLEIGTHPNYCILLRSAGIPRRALETWDFLTLKLQWKTISWCEKPSKECKY